MVCPHTGYNVLPNTVQSRITLPPRFSLTCSIYSLSSVDSFDMRVAVPPESQSTMFVRTTRGHT